MNKPINTDSCYRWANPSLQSCVYMIKFLAEGKQLDPEKGIIAIDVNRQLLIRTTIYEFSTFFDYCLSQPEKYCEKITKEQWKELTGNLKGPPSFFGDLSLVKFNIGF